MLLAALIFAQAALAPAMPPSDPQRRVLVVLHRGDILVSTREGTRRLTEDGRSRSVVKSPDSQLIAFIHQDVPPANEGDEGQTSLRVADIASGQVRQVIGPVQSTEPKFDMHAFDNPKWSLEGGFIYVDATAWMMSTAVHQIRLSTGQQRYVIDGSLQGIIREGPYRGYLLVQRRLSSGRAGGQVPYPVYLVRPDGTVIFQIDGSAADGGEQSVPKWLRDNGWSAS